VTNPGTIGYDQNNCGPFDPNVIQSIQNPSGGSGALDIIWIVRNFDNNANAGVGSWTMITGATNLTYDPAMATSSKQYRRCVRRIGCTSYIQESNIITIKVLDKPSVSLPSYPTVCDTITSGIVLSGGLPTGGTYSGNGVINGVFYPSIAGVGITTITYSYTNNYNCTAFTTATIEVVSCACNAPSTAQIVGLNRSCRGSSGISYQAVGAIGATSYVWTVPTGATITNGQGTANITVAFSSNFNGGSICVTPSNSCASASASCIVVNLATQAPRNIGPLTGQTLDLCPGTIATYCIPGSPLATNYIWTAPSGATIISGQGTTCVTLSFTSSFTNGNLLVEAVNCLGASEKLCLTLYRTPAVNSNPLVGATTICANSTANYSVATVPGTSYYHWTAPTGASIVSGQGTRSIVVSFSNTWTRGNLMLTCSSACGSNNKLYFLRSTPDQPLTAIAGPSSNVCGNTNVTYSIAPSALATQGYNWTVPSGVSIVSGQGTTSIVVSFANNFRSGSICVSNVNACGSSTPRCLSITGTPAAPSAINGPSNVCPGTSGAVYNVVNPQLGATYTWFVPSGATITSGQGTHTISVSWGSVGGNVIARSSNACGIGSSKALLVSNSCRTIEPQKLDLTINVYPNPVSSTLNLELQANQNERYSVTIKDVVGKQMLYLEDVATYGLNSQQFDMSGFAKGVYLITVNANGNSKTQKIVVQ
ncbi:MAG: putative b-glycosidase, glycoside hydrolase family 9 protein, partial [Bacteroidota bacterium]